MKSNLRFRLIATLCVLLMSAVASAFERTWDDYVEAGRQAFQKRQYAEAEKELKFALQATEKFEALDLRRAITLDRLALVYRHQRKNVKAEESYKGALAIYEKALGPERPEVATTQNWDIWSLPLDANAAEARADPERIASGLSREWYPSISADGRKLVYTSNRAGNNDIWLRDLETNKDTPVTVGPASEVRGVISPDGTKVVFRRDERRKRNVYLTQLGRGTEQLLLAGVGSHMGWTPDGKKILFYTTPPLRSNLRWKTLDVETGQQ